MAKDKTLTIKKNPAVQSITVRFTPDEVERINALVALQQKQLHFMRLTQSDIIRAAVMEMADRELPKDK